MATPIPSHPGLELPDGYVRPKTGRKKNNRREPKSKVDVISGQGNAAVNTAPSLNHHRNNTFMMTPPTMNPYGLKVPEAKSEKDRQRIELCFIKLAGPVRFIEDDPKSDICKLDPRIGYNKAQYKLARKEKYEPELLIQLKDDVRLRAVRTGRNSPKYYSLQALPKSIGDEFPNGYAPKTREEARVVLKHFPHVMLKTRVCEFAPSSDSFELTENKAPLSCWSLNSFDARPNIDAPTNPFLRVLTNAELGQKILEELAGNYFSIANLAATCATAFHIIDLKLLDRWNMSQGYFNLCDQTDEDIENGTTGENDEEIAKGLADRGVSPHVIVGPTHETLDEYRGYKYRLPLSFQKEVVSTMKFFRALHNVGDRIQHLQMHRMGLLDTVSLKAMLPMLPKLKSLSVLQCPLITFYDTKKLLLMIDDHQKKYGPVKLDFFPRIHHGCPKEEREGSFGMTWNDAGRPMKTAVGARLIFVFLPLALKTGQEHWFHLGSSFCQFLERLPLPDLFVPRVMNVVLRSELLKEYLVVDSPTYLKHMFNMLGAVLGDGAFVTGDEFAHECQYRGEGWEVWSEIWHCEGCDCDMPMWLFRDRNICDACVYASRVWDEIDHWKQERKEIAEALYTKCGMKLGDAMKDLRDNFDFAKQGFLERPVLLNQTVSAAFRRAGEVDHLRLVTTRILEFVDRGELKKLPPVTEPQWEVTRDRDWNARQIPPVLHDGFRWIDNRHQRAEEWDDMRRDRIRRRDKIVAYSKHRGLPTDEESLRNVLRTVLCKKWLRDQITGLSDHFF